LVNSGNDNTKIPSTTRIGAGWNSQMEQKTSEDDSQKNNTEIKTQPAVTTISQINIIQELQVVLKIEIPDKESYTIFGGEIRVDVLLRTLFRRIISINAP